jgi:protein-tyrosine phosphatase
MLGIRTRLFQLRHRKRAERRHQATLRELERSGNPAKKILFLCSGNICRSPVAEKLAKKLLPGLKVGSAGFYPEEGRTSPEGLKSAAQSLGADLSDWASRRVTAEMVRQTDLVVLMDLYNFRDFRREFPAEENKVAFLGMFLDPPQLSITDPYDKPPEETLRILQQIEAGVAGLIQRLGFQLES